MSHPRPEREAADMAIWLLIAIAGNEPVDTDLLTTVEELAGELESREDVNAALPALLKSLIARASGNVVAGPVR